jgi:hypothetical protein
VVGESEGGGALQVASPCTTTSVARVGEVATTLGDAQLLGETFRRTVGTLRPPGNARIEQWRRSKRR